MTYLTLREVAERLGVTEDAVRYWRYARQGPKSIKLGGQVRYDERDVASFEDHRRALADADSND